MTRRNSERPNIVPIIFVAAVAENGVIGRDNGLPWRIKSEMKYFRSVTMGKPVVMGSKTYVSIGKPLVGRTNIVVTRNQDFAARGVIAAPLDQAMEAARGDALRRGSPEIAVIGGADIFNLLMPVADRLVLTTVHASPPGDIYFPAIDPSIWKEVERRRQPQAPDDEYGFSIVTYERARAS